MDSDLLSACQYPPAWHPRAPNAARPTSVQCRQEEGREVGTPKINVRSSVDLTVCGGPRVASRVILMISQERWPSTGFRPGGCWRSGAGAGPTGGDGSRRRRGDQDAALNHRPLRSRLPGGQRDRPRQCKAGRRRPAEEDWPLAYRRERCPCHVSPLSPGKCDQVFSEPANLIASVNQADQCPTRGMLRADAGPGQATRRAEAGRGYGPALSISPVLGRKPTPR